MGSTAAAGAAAALADPRGLHAHVWSRHEHPARALRELRAGAGRGDARRDAHARWLGQDMGPASSGHGTPSHQDHSACPYAASATVAAASPWYGFALARQRSVAASAGNAQIDHFQLAPRAQSPRAPPALI